MRGSGERWQQWRDRGFFDERGVVIEYQAVGRDVTDRKRAEDEAARARGAQIGRGRAARRRSPQGRVPRHAGARAAQPAGADRDRAGDPAPGAGRRARRTVGARVDRAAAGPHDPAPRRPARHLTHHAGQDPAAARRGRSRAGDRQRRRGDAPVHRLVRARADGRAPRRAGGRSAATPCASPRWSPTCSTTRPSTPTAADVSRSRWRPRASHRVRLSMRDNGIGLAADALERIFELYSQIPAGRERAQGGLGIGLALGAAAGRAPRRHRCWPAARGPTGGASSSCDLPAIAARRAGARRAPALSRPRRAGAAPPCASSPWTTTSTSPRGWPASSACGGTRSASRTTAPRALEVARRFLARGRASSIWAFRASTGWRSRVASARRRAPAPALLVSMSGFGQEQTRRKSDEAGFHHHLVKPVDMDSLRSLLDDCVREREPDRRLTRAEGATSFPRRASGCSWGCARPRRGRAPRAPAARTSRTGRAAPS